MSFGTATSADSPPQPRQQSTRAGVATLLGGAMEFYDFILYATAATLIFPAVFFSGIPAGLATVLSFVTLAVGYIARPLGGIVCGHFGDRIGRKRMLIITMIVMGGVSVAIGLIPGSAQIGVVAPILLVTLRIVQGLAIGGEWAGGNLMALEHAPANRRGFAGSWTGMGGPLGAVLATLVFALVTAILPPDQLLSWGWRVPFIASAVIVVIALIIRAGLHESPEFITTVEAADRTERFPLLATFRESWRSLVFVALGVLAFAFLQSLTATIGISQAIAQGTPQSTALWLITLSNALTIPAILLYSLLSNRVGRLRALFIGYPLFAAVVWISFALWQQGSFSLLLLGFILIQPVGLAAVLAPMTVYAAEMFPTRYRYTGASVAYQGAVGLASGFAPLIGVGLISAAGGSLWFVAGFTTLLAAIGLVAVLLSRPTYASLNG